MRGASQQGAQIGCDAQNVHLGLPGLLRVVGKEAIQPGDIMVLVGPTGTSKTLFAAQLAVGRDVPFGRSLLVSDLTLDQMRGLVDAACQRQTDLRDSDRKKAGDFIYMPVQLGYTEPDEILADLQTLLEREAPIDRIMIGNLSRWENWAFPCLNVIPPSAPRWWS
jgi:hypothetical protein